MKNKRHLYTANHLENSKGFRNSVPGIGIKTKYMFITSVNIIASKMRSKLDYFLYINLILISYPHPTGMIENSISALFKSFLLHISGLWGSWSQDFGGCAYVVFGLLLPDVSKKISIVSGHVVPSNLVTQRKSFE